MGVADPNGTQDLNETLTSAQEKAMNRDTGNTIIDGAMSRDEQRE